MVDKFDGQNMYNYGIYIWDIQCKQILLGDQQFGKLEHCVFVKESRVKFNTSTYQTKDS